MRLLPGRFLARVTALPAIALSAWLLVAFPLLVAGWFTPLLGLLLGLPAVLVACALSSRLLPDLDEDHVPWWPVVAVLAITVAFAAVQIAYHAEALVIRRDPASYAMYTAWIAENGFLPIPQQKELIAGNDPALGYQSLAHYQRDDVIWPQFLAGAPLVLSVGYWLGGLDGMLVTTPILGAVGVLTFAGLTARLVGARWAPLAALVLAVCLPQQWVSRFTYSEPLAQILLLGGLLLAFDALTRRRSLTDRWDAPHTLAAVAGVVLGLGVLVRIDAIRDLLPVVGFVGLLLVARRGQALPLLGGLAVGVGYGLVAGYGYSLPYLEYLSDSLHPLLLISGAVILLTVVLTAALWRYGPPHTERVRWLPGAVGVCAVLVMLGFAIRPLLWPDYGHGSDFTDQWVAAVQDIEGLPIEGGRTYYDMSLYWVGWYVGLGTVLFATAGVALVLRRLALWRDPQWLLPAMVLVWTVATTLLRPAITPDHPWASRRLIVLVIPAFILFAVWFLARLTHYCERSVRYSRGGPLMRTLPTVVAAGASVALLSPTLVTSGAGIMGYRQDVGTVAATERLCSSLPPDASVIVVDSGMAGAYMPLLRNVCGAPTAVLDQPYQEAVDRVVAAAYERDRTPVLAAPEWGTLDDIVDGAVDPQRHFHVVADMDPSTLMTPPTGSWDFRGSVWTVVPPPPE
ncbi:hypothetical protein [Nocardiopsis sp. MG754419]|uniref:hypothetical protein n=1 Tax=Nocardiopsis sp. MG754419 TaxID=2259865 RepID=UPI001BA9C75D|nr:hypothetical protein [Nocardiopsis sp. MG754419]MBR8741342.1 hypothetical protein [Nocardiopsis sp. MG754419]